MRICALGLGLFVSLAVSSQASKEDFESADSRDRDIITGNTRTSPATLSESYIVSSFAADSGEQLIGETALQGEYCHPFHRG